MASSSQTREAPSKPERFTTMRYSSLCRHLDVLAKMILKAMAM
jgi:hypothetical protein